MVPARPSRCSPPGPDTIYGTTAMLLAPEHPLVDKLVADEWPSGDRSALDRWCSTPREALSAYRAQAAAMTDLQRRLNATKRACGWA